MKLTGKTILITGASSGIGKAFALRAAKDKCTLILAARRLDKLKSIKEDIERLGSKAILIQTDVTVDSDITNLFEEVSKIGKLDLVFNNAGILFVKPIYELTSEEIHSLVNTNLIGMIMVTKYASEVMMKQQFGHIIMTSSMAGLIPIPQWSVYCATKWGITGFADSIRPELKKYNIKITTLHPGVVVTELYDRDKADISLKSLGGKASSLTPEQVAEAVYSSVFTNTHKIKIPAFARIGSILYRFLPGFVEKRIERMASETSYLPHE